MNDEAVERQALILQSRDGDDATESEAADPAEAAMLARIGTLLAHPGTWQDAPRLPAALLAEIRAESGAAAEPADAGQNTERAAEVQDEGLATVTPLVRPDRPVRRWRRPSLGLAVGLAAALLVIVMFGGDLFGGLFRNDGPAEQPIAVWQLAGTSTAPAARANVHAFERAAGWRLVLDIEGLSPAPPDGYYEGWAVSGDQYVPLGTFHMHRQGQVELWSGVPLRKFSRIEVTAQRIGQSQLPGTPVMVGQM